MHFLTKLLKKIFNRTAVCVIGILLQLTYLVVIFLSFGTQYTYSYFAFVLLGVILSLYIYNMDINPSYKMAWMFAILSFPIFGVMFYVFFGNSHSGDRLRKRMTQYNDEARLLLPQNNELMSALHRDNTAAEKQAKYLYNYGGYPVYANTKTTYFPIGEAKFAAMIEELEKAQATAKELEDKVVTIKVKTGGNGKLFGSVSTKEIAAACEKQLGLEIDKKKMVLPEPIKACGTTIVPVKLHREVTAKLTVKVQEA